MCPSRWGSSMAIDGRWWSDRTRAPNSGRTLRNGWTLVCADYQANVPAVDWPCQPAGWDTHHRAARVYSDRLTWAHAIGLIYPNPGAIEPDSPQPLFVKPLPEGRTMPTTVQRRPMQAAALAVVLQLFVSAIAVAQVTVSRLAVSSIPRLARSPPTR